MTVKVEISDDVPKQFWNQIPKEHNVLKELYFNESESNNKRGERPAEDDTPIEGVMIVLFDLEEVEEFAAAVTFLCSERASYISGASLPVDGGWIKGI